MKNLNVLHFNKFLVLLLVSLGAFSQTHKLGHVTKNELEEKVYKADTTAAAAILFKSSEVTFIINDGAWRMTTETSVKIKIYKKEAYDLGNVEEDYFVNSVREQVYFTDCATYNLAGGKIEKSKLKGDGEFLETKNKDVSSKKIVLPNVKEGSIVEYKIIKHSYDIVRPDIFYMQYAIPVKYARYKMTFPVYLSYNVTLGGFLKPERNQVEMQSMMGNYKEIRADYSLSNIPALKDEAFVNNINNYRTKIIYELASSWDASDQVTNYANNWESVAKKIYESENFGGQLDFKEYFKDDLDALLHDADTRDEKINRVFQFVQSRYTWNSYNGFLCEDGVKAAYRNKTGNAAEINLTLTAMLRYAGLSANPVLISTRSNGIQYYPSRFGFNYVIVAVEIEDDLILLDATSKESVPDVLPLRALNWTGRIIRSNGSSAEVNLIPDKISRQAVNIISSISPEGQITGNAKLQLSGYQAFMFRSNYASLSNEKLTEALEERYTGTQISDIKLTDDKAPNNQITLSFGFANENLIDIIGNNLFISPLLFMAETENPFKHETREFPMDFNFPQYIKYAISISIPQGYAVESIPTEAVFKMKDGIARFTFSLSTKADQIQLLVQNEINDALVPAEYYHDYKAYYKELITKQNEKIILKKI